MNSTLGIVSLFGGEVEAPLPSVYEDGEGRALMEGVLEELSIPVIAGVWRFHLDEDSRRARRREKRMVNSSLVNGVLPPNR